MEFTTEKNRIYKAESNKTIAEVLFPDKGEGVVAITRTYVDKSLRGKGVADEMLRAVVAELQAQGKQAVAVCSYAVEWFEKHPEYEGLLKKD